MARSIRSFARRFGRKVCCIPKRSKSLRRSEKATAAQRRRRQIAQQPRQAGIRRNATVQVPRGILRKTTVQLPRAISDPGIAERGVQGLRGGGCGPSKPARPQQQPSRTSQRSNEEVMLTNLRRRYPDYGVTPSATSAGVSVLRPDTHPGADRRSASQQQNYSDAIMPRDSVRGVRGGCSNPLDDDEEVEPSRVSQPRRVWRAKEDSAMSRLRQSRDDEVRRGASKAQRYQDAMLRGGADDSERRMVSKRTILSKLRKLLCCRKAEVEDSSNQQDPQQLMNWHYGGPGREPPPIGYAYSTMSPGPLPSRTRPLAQIPEPEGEHSVPSPGSYFARLERQRSDSPKTVRRRNAAPPFPSWTRQQARVPDDDDSSQGVRKIESTDQIQVQPQSRFSASSSGESQVEADLDRESNQAKELPPLTVKEWKQAVQDAKADMAETQRSIERLERELHSGLRGGQDESEIRPPRLSLWTRLRRNLCCGRPDDDESRTSSVMSQQGSPPASLRSNVSYRYSQPHPEEGGIGLAMTLPQPDPNVATPESLLGLRPRSRLSDRDALFDNDTTASSTIRQVSEPTPKTPRITWSQSTKNRNASQPELRTPDKIIAPEDIGLPADSNSVRHRRGQSPLNGSERILPLISTVLQDSGGAQRSRRLRVQTTPPRPVTYTPFNSPTEAHMPYGLSDSEPPSAERPRSGIFSEQSPRL